MGSHELNNHHRAIQAAQGIDPDTPEATRAREIAMFGAQETGVSRKDELLALADRVEAMEQPCNGVDVLVEIALFSPDRSTTAVRSNAAGTKVIYTDADGDETCWAADWTSKQQRAETVIRLRARAQEQHP